MASLCLLTGCGSGGGRTANLVPDPAPRISEPRVDWQVSGTATLLWSTDIPATCRVDYGVPASRSETVDQGAALTNAHAVALQGLALDTSYFFRIRSANHQGLEATADGTFFTNSDLDGVGAGNVDRGSGSPPVTTISGRRTAWHPVTLSFAGPAAT